MILFAPPKLIEQKRRALPLPACFCLSATILLVLFFAGCSPAMGHLENHLDANAFDMALAEAEGDFQMESQLAALIIEREAQRDFRYASPLISFLATGGKYGSQALERLASPKGPVARLAWIALNRSSAPSNDELDDLLSDPNSDVRAAASAVWYRELSRSQLKKLVLDKDPRVRRNCVLGLSNLSTDSSTATILKDTLRLDPSPQVRSSAARAGKKLGPGALDALRRSLEDENPGVALASIRGLGKIGSKSALALLDDILSGPMEPATVVAAAELSRLGKKHGKNRLKEALENNRPTIRATALNHLESAGFKDPDEIRLKLLKDESPDVAILAAYALFKSPGHEGPVTDVLKKIWDDKVKRSDEARDLLALLQNKDALKAVKETLEEDDNEESVVLLLNRVKKSAQLRPVFLKMLADKRRTVRVAAAKACLASSRT